MFNSAVDQIESASNTYGRSLNICFGILNKTTISNGFQNISTDAEYPNFENTFSMKTDESLRKGISESELNMPIVILNNLLKHMEYEEQTISQNLNMLYCADYNEFPKTLLQYQLIEIRPLFVVENEDFNNHGSLYNVIKDECKPNFINDKAIAEEDPFEKYCKCHSSDCQESEGQKVSHLNTDNNNTLEVEPNCEETTAPAIKKSRLEKVEASLDILKDFQYEIIMRKNEATGNWNTVYKCKYHNCDKIMERTWNMIDHARMHQGIKPYKCGKCRRSFTQKGNMRKHTKLHLTINVDQRRKYPCEFCGKLYTEKYNLMTHCKSFHKNEMKMKGRD